MGLFEQKMAEKLKLQQAEPTQEEKQMPSVLDTIKNKQLSPQFDGYLRTFGNLGKEIFEQLHKYNFALERGEKDADLEKLALTENQIKTLTEKHKEFQEIKKQIENAKGIIKNEKFFHSILREPEILNDPGFAGLKSPEQVTDLLDIYFQKAFESGEKHKLDQVKEMVVSITKLKNEQIKGAALDSQIAAIAQKEGITEEKMLEAANKFYDSSTKTIDFVKLKAQITTTREKMIDRFKLDQSWVLGKYFKKRMSEIYQKVNTVQEAKFWLEQIDQTRNDVKTNLLSNLKTPAFKSILSAEILGKRAEIAKAKGPSWEDTFKNATEAASIFPDDDTFDQATFEKVFGQGAQIDFQTDPKAEAKFKDLLNRKGIDTKSVLGESYATILFGKLKNTFEKDLTNKETREKTEVLDKQKDKIKDILNKFGIDTTSLDADYNSKPNPEKKIFIVEKINQVQEKALEQIKDNLVLKNTIDISIEEPAILQTIAEKIMVNPVFSKPAEPLSTATIDQYLLYVKNLAEADLDGKDNYEDYSTEWTDLIDKSEKLNTLNESKADDTSIQNAVAALKELKNTIFANKDYKKELAAFNSYVNKIKDAKDKGIFTAFLNKFIETKNKLEKDLEAKIAKKKKATTYDPYSYKSPGAL